MTDQTEPTEQTAPVEATEQIEDAEAAPDGDVAEAMPVRRSRSTIVLAALAAVLLAFGVTMAVLYQREASARTARDRAVAARDAQLAGLRAQLAQLQTQGADLRAALKAAQDKQLDPAGYEQIKKCVQETAETEKAVAEFLSDPNVRSGIVPNGTVVRVVPRGPGNLKPSTTCTDAAKFLK